jgi:hypothetical protein
MSVIPRFKFVYQYLNRSLQTFAEALSPFIEAEASLPYKVYAAKLTQNGTANPTVTVLQNTLGQDLTWIRGNVGLYTTGTNPIAIDSSKTTITCTPGGVPSPTVAITIFPSVASAGASSFFQISTYKIINSALAEDGLLQNSLVEIRVYN